MVQYLKRCAAYKAWGDFLNIGNTAGTPRYEIQENIIFRTMCRSCELRNRC